MKADWFATVTVGTSAGEAASKVDWSRTPLGLPESWPQGLRSAVELCFSTRFPVMVGWGPELTILYNDGYQAVIGTERAAVAMGMPLRQVWSESWFWIAPLISKVLTTGDSAWTENAPFVAHRSGVAEEAHFTFSLSPLRDEDRTVRGVLNLTTELTDEIVDRRRLRLLSELSTMLNATAGDASDVLCAAATMLRDRPDIAGADMYVREGDTVLLIASTDAGGPRPSRELSARVAMALPSRTSRVRGRTVVAPLMGSRGGEAIGLVVLEASTLRRFDEAYRAFLGLVASTIGTAAAGAREHRREVEQVRGISDALQRAMLPANPTAAGWFTRYRPADGSLAVGGDWYDVVELGSGRWGLLVGDCVGQGLAAAALMGQLRSAGRALLLERHGPAETLEGLDRFARTLPGAEFTTVFCGIVDERARTLTYASAGHPPALLARAAGSVWLDDVAGFPLALGSERRAERRIALEGEDVVVLYTDGLIERRCEVLSTGLARLARTTEEFLRDRPVGELADALIASLGEGALDDVALVVYHMAG